MKLPLGEAEHEALLTELGKWEGYVSSALLAVEAIRACGRYGMDRAADARAWLEGLALVPIDDLVLGEASALGPEGLRSLDAIHLATALSLRDEIGAVLTYDRRLAEAAVAAGFTVVSPV